MKNKFITGVQMYNSTCVLSDNEKRSLELLSKLNACFVNLSNNRYNIIFRSGRCKSGKIPDGANIFEFLKSKILRK